MPRSSGDESLEHFLSLPYLAKVTFKQGRYWVFISELSLMESDEDLNTAHAKLEEAKRRQLTQMVEAGMQRVIPLPDPLERRQHWAHTLKPFAVKVAVVTVMALAAIWWVHHLSLPTMVAVFDTTVAKINDVSDDKYRDMRKQFKRALRKLSPLIEEYQAFVNPPPVPPATPTQAPVQQQPQGSAK